MPKRAGIYRDPRSPNWQIDVQFGGARLRRSSGTPDRGEAEAIVEAWRVAQRKALRDEAEGRKAQMSVDEAVTRYWNEIGCRAKSADDLDRDLAWIVETLGGDKALSKITELDLLNLAAQRRGLGARNGKKWRPCSEATINRQVLDPLRRVMLRALLVWKVDAAALNWRQVRQPEAREGRAGLELSAESERALMAALRPDIRDIMEFEAIYGVRIKFLARLQWQQVDFDAGVFRIQRKTRKPGEHWQELPLTRRAREILLAQRGRDKRQVWTYVVHKARGDRVCGERAPLTWAVLRKQFDRARKAAGLEGFRRHDYRHTVGRRTLRRSKNLRTVQRLLGHSDVATTAIYADVLIDDVRDALEDMDPRNIPGADGAAAPQPVVRLGKRKP